MRLAAAMARELIYRARTDERIWILDGDLGDSYGLDDDAIGCVSERFIQTGIAEQAMVSMAAGLAACGARPFVFSFASFLCSRAYDQIRVGISQTALPVVLIGSHAGGCAGTNGKTHAMLNDIAMMSSLPNIDVWAPADPAEAMRVVGAVLQGGKPAYVRLPREPQAGLPERETFVWRVGDRGRVAIVSTGLGTRWALAARSRLAERGIDIPLIHVGRLAPFPIAALINELGHMDRVLVVEDHCEFGGLAAHMQHHLSALNVSVAAWPQNWTGASGPSGALRGAFGLDDNGLVARVLKELDQSP